MSERLFECLATLEDCMDDEAEWQQESECVRVAFRAVHALLKSTVGQFDEIKTDVKEKVGKDVLKKAINFKANLVDVEESMDKVAEALETKVSIDDLQSILENYALKTDLSEDALSARRGSNMEARISRLEEIALHLEADESQHYAKNFVSHAELALFERRLQAVENNIVESNQFATKDEVDKLVREEVLPEVANQIREVQQGVKDKFNKMIGELERRVNADDFATIRKDIERLAREKDVSSRSGIDVKAIQEDFTELEARIQKVEASTSIVSTLKADMKTVMNVNRDIQQQLSKIASEMAELPWTGRMNELDSNFSSGLKTMESRVKKLENADKKTQELMEIMTKQRTEKKEAEGETNRSRSGVLAQPSLVEQVDEIKQYVDRKLKKLEAACLKRETFDSLEDRFEQYQNQQEQILNSLKEMIRDFTKKVKSLGDQVQETKSELGSVSKKATKEPSHVKAADEIKSQGEQQSSAVKEKLKNLDSLIAKVSLLVDKREQDDRLLSEVAARMKSIEESVDLTQADRQRICKLIDAKAEVEDVNRALIEIHNELDKGKIKGGRSSSGVTETGLVPAGVSALYSKYALWIWRTNTTSNGYVQWDAESANSDPSTIIWDRHKTGFIVVTGGLYEIGFGFFGSAKPHVELLLNEEPILLSRPKKEQDKYTGHFEMAHASGNVTGLTCVEFVILPPKARLNIVVRGSSIQEGFFLIKKV